MRNPVSLRERKKVQTRTDLVRAAVSLFQAQGYDNTTVDEIVEAANYSRSTFFRYFAGKEDVVFAGLPDALENLRLASADLGPGDDPWVVRDFLDASVPDFMAEDRELEAACVALWFAEPALYRRYTEIIMQWEREAAAVFARCWDVEVNTSVECQVIAAGLIAVGRIAVGQAVAGGGDAIPDALQRGYDLLEAGFRATVIEKEPELS